MNLDKSRARSAASVRAGRGVLVLGISSDVKLSLSCLSVGSRPENQSRRKAWEPVEMVSYPTGLFVRNDEAT